MYSKPPNTTTMPSFSFPSDLVPDLFSRLPIDSVLRFKSVSKSWLSIVETRSFSLTPSPPTQICLSKQNNGDEALYKLCQISNNGGFDGAIEEFRPLPPELSRNSPRLVGSSNGVLCLVCDDETNSIVLWNPLSSKFQTVPQPPHPNSYGSTYGFGYDEVNNDYKVLCFRFSEVEGGAMLYSLRLNSWRSIDGFPTPCSLDDPGVLLGSSLHWLSEEDGHRPLIAFDLETEEVKLCAARSSRGHLGVLRDGRLCQTMEIQKGCYMIQIMDDYRHWMHFKFVAEGGDGELRQRRVGFEQPLVEEGRCLKPIAYVETPRKPIVMIYQEGCGNNLFFYDFESKPVIEGEASDVEFSREVFPYIKTLEFT